MKLSIALAIFATLASFSAQADSYVKGGIGITSLEATAEAGGIQVSAKDTVTTLSASAGSDVLGMVRVEAAYDSIDFGEGNVLTANVGYAPTFGIYTPYATVGAGVAIADGDSSPVVRLAAGVEIDLDGPLFLFGQGSYSHAFDDVEIEGVDVDLTASALTATVGVGYRF